MANDQVTDNEQDAERAAIDSAVAQLYALVDVPGALAIILADHRCCEHLVAEYPSVDPVLFRLPGRTSGDPELDQVRAVACDGYRYPIHDPRHNRYVAVTSIQGPNASNLMRAEAEEPGVGTHVTIARPRELLARLTEVSRAGS